MRFMKNGLENGNKCPMLHNVCLIVGKKQYCQVLFVIVW